MKPPKKTYSITQKITTKSSKALGSVVLSYDGLHCAAASWSCSRALRPASSSPSPRPRRTRTSRSSMGGQGRPVRARHRSTSRFRRTQPCRRSISRAFGRGRLGHNVQPAPDGSPRQSLLARRRGGGRGERLSADQAAGELGLGRCGLLHRRRHRANRAHEESATGRNAQARRAPRPTSQGGARPRAEHSAQEVPSGIVPQTIQRIAAFIRPCSRSGVIACRKLTCAML